MTRHGKIARLPRTIREELNQRLENGEPGVRLVEWLNGLPEVNAVLKEHFEGQPISECNLTQWKNGGFLDWQAQLKAEAMIERWPLDCGLRIAEGFPKPAADGSPLCGDALSRKAGGLSEGGSQRLEDRSRKSEGGAISERLGAVLTERLMVHYAAALEDGIGDADEKQRKRVERLGQSLRDVVRVRHYELSRERARERAEMEREWMSLERERLELLRARATKSAASERQPDDKERERLMHLEKAEMVKQMLEEA